MGTPKFKPRPLDRAMTVFEKYEDTVRRMRMIEELQPVKEYIKLQQELSEREAQLKDEARRRVALRGDSAFEPVFIGTYVQVEVQRKTKADTFDVEKLQKLAPTCLGVGLVKISGFEVDEKMAEMILDGDELPKGVSAEEAELLKEALAESFKPGEPMTPAVYIKPTRRSDQ